MVGPERESNERLLYLLHRLASVVLAIYAMEFFVAVLHRNYSGSVLYAILSQGPAVVVHESLGLPETPLILIFSVLAYCAPFVAPVWAMWHIEDPNGDDRRFSRLVLYFCLLSPFVGVQTLIAL